MNLVIERARSVEILRSHRVWGSLVGVINENFGINDRCAKV